MIKDNKILGEFIMQDIPPRPKGEEKFDLVYELDADCILTATATHIGSGMSKGLIVDANIKGRMTTEEINDLIEKAEEMKERDAAEENRAMAKHKLLALCCQVKLDAQGTNKENCSRIVKIANDALTWLENNLEAEENQLRSKIESVANDCFQKANTFDDSSHVSRMNKLTAQYCLNQAKYLVKNGSNKKIELWQNINCLPSVAKLNLMHKAQTKRTVQELLK